MSSLLLDLSLTPEQREFVETIRNSGDALLDVLNDILDFSKIESGRLELEPHPFDLRLCVEHVVDLFAARCADKDIALGLYWGAGVPNGVVGDSTRLRQVLVNLVSNAVKFTERGGITISVSAEPADGGWRAGFAIEDTGIGIPAERMDRLFKSFSQVDASTTRRYGGTGLGLAISWRLIELMGGKIGVTSEVGAGSRFAFTIPLSAPPTASRPPFSSPTVDLKSRRALVVDDNPVNRRILERQLESWGMAIACDADGSAAIERFKAGEVFDVVLLDYNMPEMNGAQVIAALQGIPGAKLPPVILLTSRGEIPGAANGVVVAQMTKPVKPSELYVVVVRALGQTGVAPLERAALVSPFDRDFARRHPMRILIAEDNPVNRKVVLTMLGRLGYQAEAVCNGREVLQHLAGHACDLVVMDVQMPEMDGLQATRRIRAGTPAETPPYVLALTANARKEDYNACLESGMQDYLSKPVRIDDLMAALARAHEWLGFESRAARATARPELIESAQ
jgi:CheY-like chemotaxis protein